MKSLTSIAPARDEGDLAIDAAWTVEILSRFLVGELSRTGRSRLVVGISGGIDSAVAATLASRALSSDAVIGIRMPFRTSSPDSLTDAALLAAGLGIASETVDISPIVDGFVGAAGPIDARRLGNVMARARMTVLYDRSEAHQALVLGASNKTELLLGYGTLHGDLASALNPLGDLYKTQVRALAEHLDVPRSIRDKPPSADLWPGQTDEQELGIDYDAADRLLQLLVDARVSRQSAIEAGFAAGQVDDILGRIVRSQYKRRPPVVAKLSTRSIGWDFRYPRDWLT